MNNIKKINPFGKFCCTIGNLPTSYMVSLSYEEQLLWLCDFIKNTLIPTINNNSAVVEELQKLFLQLQDYIENYFKNLDIQTEINNKLDEMAQDGTLANIILPFINEFLHQINENSSNILYDYSTPIVTDKLNAFSQVNQGFCVHKNKYFCVGSRMQENNSNQASLSILDLSGNLLTHIDGTFYHMNSLCSDGFYIYGVASFGYNGSTRENRYEIFKFEYDEENNQILLVDTITINNSEIPFQIYGIGYENNIYYLFTSQYNIYKTTDFVSFEFVGRTQIVQNISPVPQGFSVHNNEFYIYSSNVIFVLLQNMTLKKVMNLKKLSLDKYYLFEVEEGDFLNDDLYFNSNQPLTQYMIWATDATASHLSIQKLQPYSVKLDSNINTALSTTLYVDFENASNVRNGSSDNPYKYINEAILAISQLNYNSFYLDIITCDPSERIVWAGDKKLTISGHNNTVSDAYIRESISIYDLNFNGNANKLRNQLAVINSIKPNANIFLKHSTINNIGEQYSILGNQCNIQLININSNIPINNNNCYCHLLQNANIPVTNNQNAYIVQGGAKRNSNFVGTSQLSNGIGFTNHSLTLSNLTPNSNDKRRLIFISIGNISQLCLIDLTTNANIIFPYISNNELIPVTISWTIQDNDVIFTSSDNAPNPVFRLYN